MRKLEGVVKEIVDELAYLQRREQRMRDTNGSFSGRDEKAIQGNNLTVTSRGPHRIYQRESTELCAAHHLRAVLPRCMAGGCSCGSVVEVLRKLTACGN
jgi:hypothetical protein